MGRELQKKKNRSSTPRVRQRLKSKKAANPRANAIIAERWDKTLSLKQNYDKLGLTSKLNGRAGGITSSRLHAPSIGSDSTNTPIHDPLAIKATGSRDHYASEIRVRRDPISGAILEVFEESPADVKKIPEQTPSADPKADANSLASQTIRLLEHEASQKYEKKPLPIAQSQADWLTRLFDKHGSDFDAMARDIKLNIYQESAGMLRRKLRKLGLVQ